MILPRLKYFINEKQSAITVIFLIVTIATYTFLYFTHPSLPNDAPSGWWGWFDQGQYIKSVKALSQANLSPSEHWYFPGYPLLGAILYKYMPVHPFFCRWHLSHHHSILLHPNFPPLWCQGRCRFCGFCIQHHIQYRL
jgi:hypothetical protein